MSTSDVPSPETPSKEQLKQALKAFKKQTNLRINRDNEPRRGLVAKRDDVSGSEINVSAS